MIKIYLAKMYSFIFGIFHDYFGINIRGLGFFLRIIDKNTIIKIKGKKLYLNSKISISYPRLISGQWSEPETHIFLNKLANNNEKIIFLDIGANVGEMILDMASHKNIKSIFAFELDKDCVDVINKNNKLNNHLNVEVIQVPLSDVEEDLFLENVGTPQARLSKNISENSKNTYKTKRLDQFMYKVDASAGNDNPFIIILVDVEGFEYKVLKGAKKIIEKYNPLIIFEYHKETKNFFNLDSIYEILPENYNIYKLDKFGRLETNLNNTWNCVAVSAKDIKRMSLNISINN